MFITGVNSGFGRELTEQLLARGDRVAGTVRREGSVDDLVAKYGDQFWVGHLDVTDLPRSAPPWTRPSPLWAGSTSW